MCEYCQRHYCLPSCPGASAPKRILIGLIGICIQCRKRVFRGEAFQLNDDEFFCGSCAIAAGLTPRFS